VTAGAAVLALDRAADGTGGDAGRGIDVEEAWTTVRPTERTAGRVGGGGATAQPAYGAGATRVGRGRSSGHHVVLFLCFLARRRRSMPAQRPSCSPPHTPITGRSGVVVRAAYGERPFCRGARPGPSLGTGDVPTVAENGRSRHRDHRQGFLPAAAGCEGEGRHWECRVTHGRAWSPSRINGICPIRASTTLPHPGSATGTGAAPRMFTSVPES
jgi:hypothetical protein